VKTSSRGSPRTAAGSSPTGATAAMEGFLRYTLVTAQPGRLVRVRPRDSRTIETLDGGGLAPTPFDDLLRLFRAAARRGEGARAQLGREGLPSGFRLDATSEALVEGGGGRGAPEPPAPRSRPRPHADSVDPRAPPDDVGRRGPLLPFPTRIGRLFSNASERKGRRSREHRPVLSRPLFSDLRAGRPSARPDRRGGSRPRAAPHLPRRRRPLGGAARRGSGHAGRFRARSGEGLAFLRVRREKVRAARPNDAHLALARLEGVLRG